jgi:hypothetical protein
MAMPGTLFSSVPIARYLWVGHPVFENAEPSIKPTSRGMMIDLRAEPENASDSTRSDRESFLNEIDENDWQYEKHDEQKLPPFKES